MAPESKAREGKIVEVDGIEVEVRIDPKDDWDFAVASLTLADPDATADERAGAIVRQCRLVLGDDYERVMGELRDARGGRLPIADVVSFVNRAIAAEGGNAKN